MGAQERGLKVSAILEKKPALQQACVFVRMKNMSGHVGVIECVS